MTENPDHTPLCHCGSCEDALEAAARGMETLLEHQCFHWLFAIVYLQTLAVNGVLLFDPELQVRARRLHAWAEEHADEITDRFNQALEKGGHSARSMN